MTEFRVPPDADGSGRIIPLSISGDERVTANKYAEYYLCPRLSCMKKIYGGLDELEAHIKDVHANDVEPLTYEQLKAEIARLQVDNERLMKIAEMYASPLNWQKWPDEKFPTGNALLDLTQLEALYAH